MQSENKNNKRIAIVFFVLAIAIIFILLKNSPEQAYNNIQKNRDIERELVDNKLQQTTQSMSLEKSRIRIENEISIATEKKYDPLSVESVDTGNELNLDGDKTSLETANILRPKRHYQNDNPALEVQKKLQELQQFNEEAELYREAYAQQFIENAKAAGWEVRLDENYKVISVRPIAKRTPGSSLSNGDALK